MTGSPDTTEDLTDLQADLSIALLATGAVRIAEEGEMGYLLKSGAYSPIYFDLRMLQSDPVGAKRVAVEAYATMVEPLNPPLIAPVPTAASPIVSSLSDRTGIPMVTPRVDKKAHGTGEPVDGMREQYKGLTVTLVDDLITNGKSKIEAATVLQDAGLRVGDVVVLLDREQGGRQQLEEVGLMLHAYLRARLIPPHLRREGRISEARYDRVMKYFDSN